MRVTVHVGQCGCQIGQSFWRLARSETPSLFDEDGKARTVLVDMEERVINRFEGNEMFDPQFVVRNHPGSGNNWARGYVEFGKESEYGSEALELVRRQIERCDSCDAILLFASSSGGTGSGLGSFLSEQFSYHFPDIVKIALPVIGTQSASDVVAGSYNTVLSTAKWLEHSDIVIPFDNEALARGKENMNGLISEFVVSVLSGTDNMRELYSRLIPTRKQNILVPSYGTVSANAFGGMGREFDARFAEVFAGKCQLVSVPTRIKNQRPLSLSAGLVVHTRVKSCVTKDDVMRNFDEVRRTIKTNPNREILVFNSTVSSNPNTTISLLHNTAAVRVMLKQISTEAQQLLKKKAHLHHYTEFIDVGDVEEAIKSVSTVFVTSIATEEMVIDHVHHHDSSFPGFFKSGQPPQQAGLPGQPPRPVAGQQSTWLMKNRNPPAFAPPAPSEAAASWANHASIANDKAQDALNDIIKIKTDAFNRINTIAQQAQKVMQQVELSRDSMVKDFNKEAIAVYNNYTVAKQAVADMLKMAEAQLIAAKKMASSADNATRILSKSTAAKVTTASFADKTQDPDKEQSNPEIEPILQMIRKYMASIKSGEKPYPTPLKAVNENSSTTDPLKSVAETASKESAEQSSEQMAKLAKVTEQAALKSIGDARNEAAVKAFMARLSVGTLMHDTAAAVSAALKSAKALSETVMLKELQAEKDILNLLREAQQTSLDAANEAIKAETIARRAADFTNQMAGKAMYAQNAVGQAMAAQMAQAMGYPVSVQGMPSPFPPIPVAQASMDIMTCLLVPYRKTKLGEFI